MKFPLGQSQRKLSHTLGFLTSWPLPARPELSQPNTQSPRAGSTYEPQTRASMVLSTGLVGELTERPAKPSISFTTLPPNEHLPASLARKWLLGRRLGL